MSVIAPLPSAHLRAEFQLPGTTLGEVTAEPFRVRTLQSAVPTGGTLCRGTLPEGRQGGPGALASSCIATRMLCHGTGAGTIGRAQGAGTRATTSLLSPELCRRPGCSWGDIGGTWRCPRSIVPMEERGTVAGVLGERRRERAGRWPAPRQAPLSWKMGIGKQPFQEGGAEAARTPTPGRRESALCASAR